MFSFNLLHVGKFLMVLVSFIKLTLTAFETNHIRNTIRELNGLDPDLDRRFETKTTTFQNNCYFFKNDSKLTTIYTNAPKATKQ